MSVVLVWLHTKRYSAVVRKFLERYPGHVEVDRKPVHEPVEAWCTNNRLYRAVNFSLVHNGLEVLGFHDGPSNMWAHESATPFVEQLARERLLRFTVARGPSPLPRTGIFHQVIRRLFGT